MQDESNWPPEMDARLRRALSHSKRVEILSYLTQKRDRTGTSEGELSSALGLGIRLAEYHLRVLHGAGLIVRVEEGGEGRTGRSFIAAASAGL
jgi:DNA-binding transcriptional ArsR family regulator